MSYGANEGIVSCDMSFKGYEHPLFRRFGRGRAGRWGVRLRGGDRLNLVDVKYYPSYYVSRVCSVVRLFKLCFSVPASYRFPFPGGVSHVTFFSHTHLRASVRA